MEHMVSGVHGITKKAYYDLCEQIWEHNRKYFVENAPTISDYDFDQLLNALIEIEKKHPDWIYSGSPTQNIGEMISGRFAVVPHRFPMLSLSNTYSQEELQEFIDRMFRLLHKKELNFATELKMDGIAISIRYEEGFLVQGVTRGNGKEGEDITQNLLTIKNLPMKLKGLPPPILEVRGEVFMPKRAFAELNRKKEEEGEAPFANPRNAAAGSLKLLDSREVAKRHLDIAFYGIAEDQEGHSHNFGLHPSGSTEFFETIDRIHEEHFEGKSDQSKTQVNSHYEALSFLETLGLPIVQKRKLCHNFDDIWAFAERVEKERRDLPYEIDGIVVKVDDLSYQKKLGMTGKSYRWAVAYKFSPDRVETVIQDITVQVGRTGVLTPVAELIPVFLAGSTISRATLHNEDEVKRKDIRIGDTVSIEKGGDVIPKVVEVNFKLRPHHSKPWKMPDRCPACGTSVIRVKDEVAIRCPNRLGCPAQELKRIIHFASKVGMDIEHLGEKNVTHLVERGFVKRISDIYTLTSEELFQLKNFKEKSVENLLSSIEKSKDVSLSRFLMALGIKHVGAETAELLAERVGDIDALSKMREEDFLQFEGIGEKVAESIVGFFADPENQEEIKRLLELGVKPKIHEVKGFKDHPFFGKTFVLTGALQNFTRDSAASLIRERGGKVSGTVSKSTDVVLAGEDPGSKYEKAKKLGISLMSEEEFVRQL